MSSSPSRNKLPDNFFRVRWQFDERIRKIGKWLTYVLPLLLLVTSVLGQPAVISPFITTYLDVLDANSQWAVPYLEIHRGASLYFAAAFIFVLTASLFLLYAICIGSEKVDGVRTFAWPKFGQTFNWRWTTVACFFIMLVANMTLFDYYSTALETGEALFLNDSYFRLWYTMALLFRIVCVVAGLSAFLKIFLADFARKSFRFRRKYLTYFYPSLLSIAMVALVFTQMDQFDSLFVALIQDPVNFFFFTVMLFPVSLIVVWFIPSYLNFTDVQYSERNKAWRIMTSIIGDRVSDSYKTYRWLYSHKRLFNGRAIAEEERKAPEYFLEDHQQGIPYPPPVFRTVATLLGLLFVLTLLSVCVDIYDRTLSEDFFSSSSVIAVAFGLVLIYWVWCGKILGEARKPENLAFRRLPRRKFRRKNLLTDWWHNLIDRQPPEGIEPGSDAAKRKTFYYVADRRPFRFGFWMAIVMLALLATMLGLVSFGVDWQFTYPVYLVFLFVTPFVFVWLSVFQDFHPYYTFDKTSLLGPGEKQDTIVEGKPTAIERRMDLFDATITQVMLYLVIFVAALSVFIFAIGLLTTSWLSSPALQSINPLNLYLILVNGTIAVIVLIDRYINLRNYNKQYNFMRAQLNEKREWEAERAAQQHLSPTHNTTFKLRPYNKVETPYLFWGSAVVLVWLATTYIGNSYHEVTYNEVSKEQVRQQLSLADYTANFLTARPDTTSPVVFIGADGGGLKACYWTMRVLHHLDSAAVSRGQKDFYNDRVFLTSGASGGSIGLSMYTVLKAHLGDDLPAIRDRIETIGATNFLSGDFAGLLTRFPLNYVPENLVAGGPRRYQDRAEAMAEAYFNIVFADDPKLGFPVLSKEPYWYLWAKNDYQMPIFVANTARGEDGVRGLVHPLRPDPSLTPGALDLSRNDRGAISFPGAAFLSNRFPLMSPPARIIGKGHFLDAGSADNSGLATIYDFLRYMKANSEVDSTRFRGDATALVKARKEAEVYRKLLERPVVVLSVRNAMSRFVRDEFLPVLDSIHRFYYQPDLTASTAAAVNSGIAGVPIAWDDYLRSSAPRDLGILDTFMTVNLPFRLRSEHVFQSLGGELKDTTLHWRIDAINRAIHKPLGADSSSILAPPLGRLLAQPSREFMGRMLLHEQNAQKFEWLLRDGN